MKKPKMTKFAIGNSDRVKICALFACASGFHAIITDSNTVDGETEKMGIPAVKTKDANGKTIRVSVWEYINNDTQRAQLFSTLSRSTQAIFKREVFSIHSLSYSSYVAKFVARMACGRRSNVNPLAKDDKRAKKFLPLSFDLLKDCPAMFSQGMVELAKDGFELISDYMACNRATVCGYNYDPVFRHNWHNIQRAKEELRAEKAKKAAEYHADKSFELWENDL